MSAPPGFAKITPTIYLHRPISPTSFLILSTWMGASPRLVNKYIKEYTTRFPSMTILLLLSEAKSIFLPFLTDPTSLYSSAIDILLNAKETSLPMMSVTYSNGGCHTLCTLAKVYKARTGEALQLSSQVFDSAPGSGDIGSGSLALTSNLPSTIQRNPALALIANSFVYALIWLYAFICSTFKITDPISRLRIDLNDQSLFALTVSYPKRRTYIYSDTDHICPAAAIESSAAEAGRKGWNVDLEEVKNSRHVAHAAVAPERYWGIMERALKV